MNSPKPKKSKRPGTDRRWTLLFIGDHGNVVTLKRFKAIVLATGFLFLVATLGLNFSFFKNKTKFPLIKQQEVRLFTNKIYISLHEYKCIYNIIKRLEYSMILKQIKPQNNISQKHQFYINMVIL